MIKNVGWPLDICHWQRICVCVWRGSLLTLNDNDFFAEIWWVGAPQTLEHDKAMNKNALIRNYQNKEDVEGENIGVKFWPMPYLTESM